jgi:hypothetical protein
LEHLPTLGTEEPVRLGGGVTGGTAQGFIHGVIILGLSSRLLSQCII